MGGGEVETDFSPLSGVNQEDIAGFVSTGYEGASTLYDAGTASWKNPFNGEYQKMTDRIITRSGKDITKVWGDFNTWLDKTKKSKVDHEEYVALKKEAPGRDSTIVGFNQEKQGTVLGNTQPYGKTVLG